MLLASAFGQKFPQRKSWGLPFRRSEQTPFSSALHDSFGDREVSKGYKRMPLAWIVTPLGLRPFSPSKVAVAFCP